MKLVGRIIVCTMCVLATANDTIKHRDKRQISIKAGNIVLFDIPKQESSEKQSFRPCKTATGGGGFCRDLSICPSLLLDLSNLRNSICFQSLFVPGVCCPDDLAPTPKTTTTTTTERTSTEHTTTERTTTTKQPVRTTSVTLRPASVGLKPAINVTKQEKVECGVPQVPSFRIVGGDEARPGEWPWMAAIYLHGPNRVEFWCGGSLISRDYVITAAHCTKDSKQKSFSPQQYSIRLGAHNINSNLNLNDPDTYFVTEVIAHENFRGHGFYNDIALFKLSRPADFNEYVRPVCLPDNRMLRDTFVGHTPTIIGWGTTYYGGRESSTLQQVKLPVWRNEDCDKSYFQPIEQTFLCAGYADGGADACQGDSGGPMQTSINGKWYQIGIVSFGNRCAEPGYPGVYTRITEYMDWIHRHSPVYIP